MPNAPEDMTGHCFLCQDTPTGPDDFCAGCHEDICEGCRVNQRIPSGVHEPEDHLDANDD